MSRRRARAVVVLLATSLVACGDDGPPAAVAPDTATTRTDEPKPGLAAPEPTVSPSTAPEPTEPLSTAPEPNVPPSTAPGPGAVTVVEVGEFDRPVDLVHRPGDPSLYVVEQTGAVVRWSPDDDRRDTVLDLAGRISDGGEQGLLGLAFTPDGGTAYVHFTDVDGATTIVGYDIGDTGSLDPGSERPVLTVEQPYRNHNGGDLWVDPTGALYVALGDGGSSGDPERRAHDPTQLLGKLLRIRPADRGPGYTIPADNPFAEGTLVLADGTTVDGAPEVLAWGLRNPWKFSVDPVTGDLWIPDVGQNEMEEVNVVGPVDGRPVGWAHDFGWSAFEGTLRFDTEVPDPGRTTPPVHEYRHGDDGCSVSGGEVYRGTTLVGLDGWFVFGDYCSGVIRAVDRTGSTVLRLLDGFDGITAVRADSTGELYVLEAEGRVSRLVPA